MKPNLKAKLKIKLILKLEDVEGNWEIDPKTNKMKVTFDGQIKEDGMGKGGLTAADKAWIAGLIRTINDRLDIIEKDVSEIKDRLKAIEECPTIKKELKKDDE